MDTSKKSKADDDRTDNRGCLYKWFRQFVDKELGRRPPKEK